MSRKLNVIGLMSGTSLDAIDVALIETDGENHVVFKAFEAFPYDPVFREKLRSCFGKKEGCANPDVAWAEDQLTQRHAYAVKAFLEHHGLSSSSVDLIGFHGQTIWHHPGLHETLQIGNGEALAQMTGIDVVYDFRTADVRAGGQGAPLVPLYHRALAQDLPKPVAIINIGGVSNVTWIGHGGEEDMLAFDLGPGNAMIDDWVMQNSDMKFDEGGALAARGRVDHSYINLLLEHPYFYQKPPKSLDRNGFMNFMPKGLSLEDGAATLTMMTVAAIVDGLQRTPQKPLALYVTGGGRHNTTMMHWLYDQTRVPVRSVDELGWRGDSMEAEAFAYLAVRSMRGMPISLPGTTGVFEPMTGGKLLRAKS